MEIGLKQTTAPLVGLEITIVPTVVLLIEPLANAIAQMDLLVIVVKLAQSLLGNAKMVHRSIVLLAVAVV
jgi:hypothetical protein